MEDLEAVSTPMKWQLSEINGRVLGKADYEYHNPLYKDLLASVIPLRQAYREENDVGARKEMATEELTSWTSYLESRKEEISRLEEVKESIDRDVDQLDSCYGSL